MNDKHPPAGVKYFGSAFTPSLKSLIDNLVSFWMLSNRNQESKYITFNEAK